MALEIVAAVIAAAGSIAAALIGRRKPDANSDDFKELSAPNSGNGIAILPLGESSYPNVTREPYSHAKPLPPDDPRVDLTPTTVSKNPFGSPEYEADFIEQLQRKEQPGDVVEISLF